MGITHWDKIRELEAQMEAGDFQPLVDFFVFLKSKGNFANVFPHLFFTVIAGARSSQAELWNLLHEFCGQLPPGVDPLKAALDED